MMSISARRELLAQVAPRYRTAPATEKSLILDEFVHNTGYHRKYALALLHGPPPDAEAQRKSRTRRRSCKYPAAIRAPLVTLWQAANSICAKRLVPFLPELITVLERHQELHLEPSIRALLLQISPATVDRLLRHERQVRKPRGLGTTKPGTLLKRQIPVRTFSDWDETRPGFLEVDLVAHCGQSTEGEYLYTLVLTDLYTAWTVCVALRNRSQETVSAAIARVRESLPFPLLGIDSDNGSEFINANLLRYCQQERITFTRSRPYRKNDQAHVEQKNWTHVRQFVGHERFAGLAAHHALTALYEPLNLYMNFFQPTLKLVAKERLGERLHKHYDAARTPFRRMLEVTEVSADTKVAYSLLYETLNPLALLRQLDRLREQLWALEIVRFPFEATIPQE
jgi:IS30 family transposase